MGLGPNWESTKRDFFQYKELGFWRIVAVVGSGISWNNKNIMFFLSKNGDAQWFCSVKT